MPEPPSIDERQARAMVRAIIDHHFGSKPKRINRKGGGISNFVFEANHTDGDFIVRMNPQPGKIKEYLKEQWAMARAQEVGVPVPEVLEVGADIVPIPYMISRKVEGTEATHHPERMAILREMGRLTALIHTIPTSGFGHTFDWSNNQLSRKENWAEYLKRELNVEQRLKVLDVNKMLSKSQLKSLHGTLRSIEDLNSDPVLNHGDMRLKNVMADEAGEITAVIDWEFCSSNIAPFWDLALSLHDLSVDAKQAFLGGYGSSEAEIRKMAPILKAINVINYAPFVERAAEEKDQRRLDQYRTRFSGALDLYSL
ncbi:phosphotransferase family protein [Microvirga zambiensis]|uniref:phosphotransferase family protein n=1 Tax=Microvirga zambiensis TaxID=1402137 RepID=UPI00191FBBB4|nr:phosphotransferase [Microvirga zambiensis]